MNSLFKKLLEKPIFILLAVNVLIGGLTFRDYGLAWDEPLFYKYADALGYAYSPREWFSGHFDLENSYGPSGDDHKTRGPAYLFLAREPVYALETLGLDEASAWHLVNFLFFQVSVYLLYRLSTRWMNSFAALAASALFSWQPLLWGHAFINPKDPPFLVFFLASVCFGFEMADKLTDDSMNSKQKFIGTIFPAILLGMTISIRVLGPLAGLLVGGYVLWRLGRKLSSLIPHLILYGVIAALAMLITWPFLWANPAARFVDVFRLMSDNPTNLSVLFGGQIYRAGELPRRYMPFMLAATLTEPVWFLFVFGVNAGYWKLLQNRIVIARKDVAAKVPSPGRGLFTCTWRKCRCRRLGLSAHNDGAFASLTLVLLWFIIPVAYILLRRPAMYDGLRHFLFILPPIFIFTGFTFEFLFEFLMERVSFTWLRAGAFILLTLPGVFPIVQLHPYEYTYYNSFIGGTGNAFRNYETDYWLTCYKDAVQSLDDKLAEPFDLYVHREAYIAAYYADDRTHVHELRGALDQVKPGDYVLVNTRTNEDRRVFKDAPPVIQISRGDALFCIIKKIP